MSRLVDVHIPLAGLVSTRACYTSCTEHAKTQRQMNGNQDMSRQDIGRLADEPTRRQSIRRQRIYKHHTWSDYLIPLRQTFPRVDQNANLKMEFSMRTF